MTETAKEAERRAPRAPPYAEAFEGRLLWRRCLRCLRVDSDALWERLRRLTDEIVEQGLNDLSVKISEKRLLGVEDPCLQVLRHPVIQRVCTERAFLAELAVYRTWLDRYRVLDPPAACECGYEQPKASLCVQEARAKRLSAEQGADPAEADVARRQEGVKELQKKLQDSEEEERQLQAELDQLLTEIVDENRENVRLRTRLACRADRQAHPGPGNSEETRGQAQDEARDFAALIQDVTRRCARLSMMASCLANASSSAESTEPATFPASLSTCLPLRESPVVSPLRLREPSFPEMEEQRKSSPLQAASPRLSAPSAVATPGVSAGSPADSPCGVRSAEREEAVFSRSFSSEQRVGEARKKREMLVPNSLFAQKRRREDLGPLERDGVLSGGDDFEKEVSLRRDRDILVLSNSVNRLPTRRAVTPPRTDLHASREGAFFSRRMPPNGDLKERSAVSRRAYQGRRERAGFREESGGLSVPRNLPSQMNRRYLDIDQRVRTPASLRHPARRPMAPSPRRHGESLQRLTYALPAEGRSWFPRREDDAGSEEFLSIRAESPLPLRDEDCRREFHAESDLRRFKSAALLRDAHAADKARDRGGEEGSPATPARLGASAERAAATENPEDRSMLSLTVVQRETREEETSPRRTISVGTAQAAESLRRSDEVFGSTERRVSRKLNQRQPESPAASASQEATWVDICLGTTS
ncbi:hypothetical protein TGPRC2_277710 [Toxoplasma gondii TgCatPRC2]|uniref:Uncharacterized protein n=1 Tax=Toxoplasma gondii TgCatPRC2 TaxID=1130821 RepID=A0A151H765_TOXGO|nr:hypothetical protein TGPRC2_277710 [Toxoplasma gondii TgCatPRC2]